MDTFPVTAQRLMQVEILGSATHAERVDTSLVTALMVSPVVAAAAVAAAATVEHASGVAALITGPATAPTAQEVKVVARGASDVTAVAIWDT